MALTIVQPEVGGTGVGTFPSPGTAGNLLTSNGTVWTSAAASGSPLVFLQTSNITSSVASVTFSSLDANTYISYMVSFEGIAASSSAGRLELNLGTSSGIITSGDYFGTVVGSKSSSTTYPTFSNSSSDSTMYITHPSFSIRSDSSGGVSGVVWISNINNTYPPHIRSQTTHYNSNSSEVYNMFSTYVINLTSQTITQVRIRYAGENLTKGRITVYGLKAS